MKKSLFKALALMLTLVLVVGCFAACGGNTDNGNGGNGGNGSEATEAPKGETQTWGNLTVFVPEGLTLKGGSLLDEESPDDLTLNGTGLNYIQVGILNSEDNAKDNLELTKSMNEESNPQDVSVEANGTTWTGVSYNSYGYDCFQLYASVNGKIVQVMGAGFTPNSDTVTAVLGSISVK